MATPPRSSNGPTPPAIAVIAHLYYPDVWLELRDYLNNIQTPFDMYVTIPSDNRRVLAPLVVSDYPNAEIVEFENKGRDLGPFFKALLKAEARRDYLAICKIHTKKGITEAATWRHMLLESVLGSEQLVENIIDRFHHDERLCLVGARDLYFSGPKFVELNKRAVGAIGRALYAGARPPDRWGFFAGTMFWLRPRFFWPLARYVAETVSFEAEGGANDGEVAHALERIIGLIASASRGHIGLVSPTGHDGRTHAVEFLPAPGEPSSEPPIKLLKRRASEFARSSGRGSFG